MASFQGKDDTCDIMRVHLSARAFPEPSQPAGSAPVLLTVRAAHWLPGHSEHRTTAPELLNLLRRRTDVNELALDRFGEKLRKRQDARLFHVDLSDDVLEHLGFFLD